MKTPINEILNRIKQLEVATHNLGNALSVDWDDEVKTSFRKYIAQCNHNLETIRYQKSKLIECSQAFESVNVEKIIAEANKICSEVTKV